MKTAEMIKNDVEQELRWEPSICATKIGFSVNDGVVELDGHYESAQRTPSCSAEAKHLNSDAWTVSVG
jgi:osmotically-inducible protein OsmY